MRNLASEGTSAASVRMTVPKPGGFSPPRPPARWLMLLLLLLLRSPTTMPH